MNNPQHPGASAPWPQSVLVAVNDLQPYGSQRVAMALAEALLDLGLRTLVLTVEGSTVDDLVVPAGIERLLISRKHRGARGYASVVQAARLALKDARCDLVISHMLLTNLVTVAANATNAQSARVPVMITEHSNPSRSLVVERSPRALRTLARVLYPRAAGVVGVSDSVVDDVADTFGVSRHRLARIYNPVDVRKIRASAAPAPHTWLTDGRRGAVVVCVGGFRPAKGQDVLLRALRYAPQVRVILVGDGPLRDDLEHLAADLGVADRTAFVGYRDDVASYMRHAAAVVVPSRWEGFGLVAVEAAAVGTPVVGTRVSALRELVPASVPGVLVAPEDPVALADALIGVTNGTAVLRPAHLDDFAPADVARRYLDTARRFTNRPPIDRPVPPGATLEAG